MKTCSKCLVPKDESEFYKYKKTGKPRPWCKECFKKASVANRRNQDKNKRAKMYRRCNLRRWYGISVDDYEKMLAEQGGVCAICGRPPKNGKALSVDHNHETGEVRGLLCNGCNFCVGVYEVYQDRFDAHLRRYDERRDRKTQAEREDPAGSAAEEGSAGRSKAATGAAVAIRISGRDGRGGFADPRKSPDRGRGQ